MKFEDDEARYEIAKINISIAKERLRIVQSGAKKEDINYAATQISALENEIEVLQKRYESNKIVTPISGILEQTYSSDTLLVIYNTSKHVIIIPINWNDSQKLQVGQNVLMSSSAVDEEIHAQIISIGNSVNTSNIIQYVLVTAISSDIINHLKPGLYVNCKIECESVTALEVVSDFIKPFYR